MEYYEITKQLIQNNSIFVKKLSEKLRKWNRRASFRLSLFPLEKWGYRGFLFSSL